MKKLLLLSTVFLFLIACNTKKEVAIALNSGNYDHAISTSIGKLQKNKYKERNFEYAIMLQDAFHKASDRDLKTIAHLKNDNNPELYQKIYELYLGLNSRQRKIQPLLPLMAYGDAVKFNFQNYSEDIIDSKDNLSDFVYKQGSDLLASNVKGKIRSAYHTFKYLDRINPDYQNTRELLEEAHQLGVDYVYVSINNDTDLILPRALEEDLLDLDIYNHNKLWSVYHSKPNNTFEYDYAIQLNIKNIEVSPEKVERHETLREREIVDGWKYELDADGNVAKDTLGNDIKVDNFVKIECMLIESIQFKSSLVVADVEYVDLETDQIVDKFNINSSFVFENTYAKVFGDERAIIKEDEILLNNREVPFPSNEQMVYDTGEDLKLKLKDIIKSYTIRH
jgi:hypothetical protein